MEFIHYAFQNIEGIVKGDAAVLMLNMHYDEFMNMVNYTPQLLMQSPLAPMRQWDMESHGAFSKERERMRMFAKLRIAEHIPGLTWEQFSRLTPEQTEWAMEIAQEEMKKKAHDEGEAGKGLKDMARNLGKTLSAPLKAPKGS